MSWVRVKEITTGKIIYDSEKENRKAWLESQEKRKMSNLVPKDFTPDQLELIRSTIAKGATPDELKLFLYRCKHLGADPFVPGQIYFVKYGNSPGTIVLGLEWFRSKAASTGKHTGTQRGVIRDESGKCLGAWCEVSRSDWTRPAREEVSLHEYNTGKAQWAKMPETMIRKVAEAAALRMAFPDQLGGVYTHEEMDQARDHHHKPQVSLPNGFEASQKNPYSTPTLPQIMLPQAHPGEYKVAFGKKYKGQRIQDIDPGELSSFITWCEQQAEVKGLPLSHDALTLKVNFDAYIAESEIAEEMDSQPKFEDWESDNTDPTPFFERN